MKYYSTGDIGLQVLSAHKTRSKDSTRIGEMKHVIQEGLWNMLKERQSHSVYEH